jgi:hypothetical protein
MSTVIAPRSADVAATGVLPRSLSESCLPRSALIVVDIGGDAAEIAVPPGDQMIINPPVDLVNGSKVTIQTASGSM